MTSHEPKDENAVENECINSFKIDTNYAFQKDRNLEYAPDTGQWFFHHPEYESFRNIRGLQLLFITAEAGGKYPQYQLYY